MGRVSIRRILNHESTDVKDNAVYLMQVEEGRMGIAPIATERGNLLFSPHTQYQGYDATVHYIYTYKCIHFFYDVSLKFLWYFSKLGYVFNTDFSLITASGRSKVISRVLPQ